MSSTAGVLSDKDVNRVVQNYLRNSPANLKDVEQIIAFLNFYAEAGLIAESVLSGEFDIVGVNENGLQYQLSANARKHMH